MSDASSNHQQLSAWFRAGREVAQALTLLSDAGFKLYMLLCLEADLQTGRGVIATAAITKVLEKDAVSIEASFSELHVKRVCKRRGDWFEIDNRFWPYERDFMGGTAESAFVAQVRDAYLSRACVTPSFKETDEIAAVYMCQHGTTLDALCRAILLGCARWYDAGLNGGKMPALIMGLAYFGAFLGEASQSQPSEHWTDFQRNVEELEQRWLAVKSIPERSPSDTQQMPRLIR